MMACDIVINETRYYDLPTPNNQVLPLHQTRVASYQKPTKRCLYMANSMCLGVIATPDQKHNFDCYGVKDLGLALNGLEFF